MFLSLKEIIHEKSRFLLIIAVVVLVSYLAFFLTALANGLATSYSQAIDKWKSSAIILKKDANKTIARSMISDEEFNKTIAPEKAKLGVTPVVVSSFGDIELIDSFIFAIENNSIIKPTVYKGEDSIINNSVILDSSFEEAGYKIGNEISFADGTQKYKITGFTKKSTYQTAPVIYMSFDSWNGYRADNMSDRVMGIANSNAIIIKGNIEDVKVNNESLEAIPINDYIFSLPGYNAQVLTFSTMILALIAIASFVLAIFIYILTIQKKSMFGILKAQGISNAMISASVIMQTIIIALFGMIVGFILAGITGYALRTKIPFMIDPIFFIGISLLFLVFSIFGGLFSVRAVTKIDPIKAIG